MKLGLISDIHADYGALVSAINRLETVHNVNEILCAGDLTGYGTEPDEVIALIRDRSITTVRGNHDSPSVETSEADAEFLKNLPFEWHANRFEKQLYMCHGIPGVNFIGFTPNNLEKPGLREMVSELKSDFIIAGHTHHVLCQKVNETWILNPGSVFTQSDGGTSHSYGVLDLSRAKFSVYDVLRPPVQHQSQRIF